MKNSLILALALLIIALFPLTAYGEPIISPWAQPSVEKAISLGLIESSDSLDYTQKISREVLCQIVVVLTEQFGGEIFLYKGFPDTDSIAVKKLAGIGIVSGVSGNYFAPDAQVTREQMAVILVRLLNTLDIHAEEIEPHTFADQNAISPWAADSVAAVRHFGLMSGDAENRFNAQAPLTVEQSISVLVGLYDLLDKEHSS